MKRSVGSPLAVIFLIIVIVLVIIFFNPSFSSAPTAPSTTHLLSADAYPLYTGSGLAWSQEFSTTTVIGTQSLAGYESTSTSVSDISNLATVFLSFEEYYKEKLTASGWSVDNSLAAGGAGSGILAYEKSGNYILLGYQTIFQNTSADQPETCPCSISFTIFSGK